MWSASASLLAHNSSSQENDFRKAISLESKKVLSSVAAAEIWLYLGPDPGSPEPGQSPIKVNGAWLGHQDLHRLSQEQSHNNQESRQKGLLKMRFCHNSVHFKIPAISRRYVGPWSACGRTVEKTVTGQATEWRVNILMFSWSSFFRKIIVLNEYSRSTKFVRNHIGHNRPVFPQ